MWCELRGPSVASREERRWIEKQNKAVRQKKKKEEMARLRLLVGKLSSLHFLLSPSSPPLPSSPLIL